MRSSDTGRSASFAAPAGTDQIDRLVAIGVDELGVGSLLEKVANQIRSAAPGCRVQSGHAFRARGWIAHDSQRISLRASDLRIDIRTVLYERVYQRQTRRASRTSRRRCDCVPPNSCDTRRNQKRREPHDRYIGGGAFIEKGTDDLNICADDGAHQWGAAGVLEVFGVTSDAASPRGTAHIKLRVDVDTP